jgi:putative membrane protein
MRVAIKIVVNGIGIYVSALLAKPAIEFVGSGPGLLGTVLWVALLFGVVNTFALPTISFFRAGARWPTVALFTFGVNALLLWLISTGSEHFAARLHIQNFWPALIGGVIATTVSLVLHAALPDAKNHRSLTEEMA